MVEMVETAAILNQAGEKSLVILDEIGRGTATYDGLSIAWASLEHLHEINRCRALFATHYHELNALSSQLSALAPYTMRVKEWKGEVRFLHEIAPGSADRSYGIHVAELAGLPKSVIQRASQVLATLEKSEGASALARIADELPLFEAAARTTIATTSPNPALAALEEINPDELSPREALNLLFKLKSLAARQ
jgi:DNA mismatch repair protein MutS